jgi:hypothetical protein
MSRRAAADGDFGSSQAAPANQAAEEIVFVDNPDSTMTAIIQLNYARPSQPFAWVIPVAGSPKVGVSSNAVFERLDAATAPQYWVEAAVEGKCMPEDVPDAGSDAAGDTGGASSSADTSSEPVAVTEEGSVGPFDYASITVDPTRAHPAKTATDWFAKNGYDLAGVESDVLSRYVKDGLHLLAFKLTKETDVGAIRPVALTYESKLPTIPIRPAAAGARGIQVWVVGPSQAVPDNTKSLVINDALIDWLTGRTFVAGTLPSGGVGPFEHRDVGKPSNYDALVAAAGSEAAGQGFVTELAAPASRYRGKVWSSMDDEHFATISKQKYADGIDAVIAANGYYTGWDGMKDAIGGAATLPAGVTIDEFGRHPDRYRGVAKVNTAKFFRLVDRDVVKPVSDAAAMLYKAPYLTRLYSGMRLDEMTVDPTFNYNADLALVSNIHIARRFIQCRPNLRRDDAPWRVELPQRGVVVGKGRAGWPVALGSMPANLKTVQLSVAGSGIVAEDNSNEIGMALLAVAGSTASGMSRLRAPLNGVMIGGTQTVTSQDETSQDEPGPTYGPRPENGHGCSVSNVSNAGSCSGVALPLWLSPAGLALARRGRRAQRASRRSLAKRGGRR